MPLNKKNKQKNLWEFGWLRNEVLLKIKLELASFLKLVHFKGTTPAGNLTIFPVLWAHTHTHIRQVPSL